MYYLGIDIGSLSCDAVLLDHNNQILAEAVVPTGARNREAIRLDGEGRVADFAMNDKCAAGTGRFLEAMARALQVDILELSELD